MPEIGTFLTSVAGAVTFVLVLSLGILCVGTFMRGRGPSSEG